MKEEINILGATLLKSPRGPLCNRHDARDEESLREPARLPGVYGKIKDTPKAREDQQRMKDPYNNHTDKGHQSSYALRWNKTHGFTCI